MKKILKFLSSMRFAIILLLVLIGACAAGSFVTQGQSYGWYAQRYSERTAAMIVALHLDDAFHSWWFIAITAFLCLNLLLCNVLRLPALLRRWRNSGSAEGVAAMKADAAAGGCADPEAFFTEMGFGGGKKKRDDGKDEHGSGKEDCGGGLRFRVKNRAGLWGAWICHLGILLIILGFGLGQMLKEEYSVYGVPGQSKPIGGTGYTLTIDKFDVDLRDDDTVRQYTAGITVRDDAAGTDQSGEVSVNHPASFYGMKFYQNSTGWAADMTIQKDGDILQEETVCAGDYAAVKDKPELVIYFNAFYPDYLLEAGRGPMTASSKLNNPAYLYSVYYQGQMLGMNALLDEEELTIDEYTVTFGNPRSYTLIQVKRDPFTPLALLGGLVTMLGLALAFYVQPMWIRALPEDGGTWRVEGGCAKGGAFFAERFREAADRAGLMMDDGGSEAEPIAAERSAAEQVAAAEEREDTGNDG